MLIFSSILIFKGYSDWVVPKIAPILLIFNVQRFIESKKREFDVF